jgi:hypothetical protein
MTGVFYSNIFYDNGYVLNSPYADGFEIVLSGYTGYTYANSVLSFYNNTFYSVANPNTNQAGMVAVGINGTDITPATITFKNNIFYAGSGITSGIFFPIRDRWNLMSHSNNLVYRASSPTAVHVFVESTATTYDRAGVPTWEPTAQNTDPLFISDSDFHLQNISPAINAGTDVGLTEDYAGNPIVGAPDIGAYEYQGTDVTPPSMPSGLSVN